MRVCRARLSRAGLLQPRRHPGPRRRGWCVEPAPQRRLLGPQPGQRPAGPRRRDAGQTGRNVQECRLAGAGLRRAEQGGDRLRRQRLATQLLQHADWPGRAPGQAAEQGGECRQCGGARGVGADNFHHPAVGPGGRKHRRHRRFGAGRFIESAQQNPPPVAGGADQLQRVGRQCRIGYRGPLELVQRITPQLPGRADRSGGDERWENGAAPGTQSAQTSTPSMQGYLAAPVGDNSLIEYERMIQQHNAETNRIKQQLDEQRQLPSSENFRRSRSQPQTGTSSGTVPRS